MASIIRNARVFDGHALLTAGEMDVLVEDGRIREISSSLSMSSAEVIDIRGKTLMPGLIDAHFHVYASDVDVRTIEAHPPVYSAMHGLRKLSHALQCGFTTIRDVGGGDYAMSKAIDDGLITAPRLFYAGKILSMTGGHGDFRGMAEEPHGLCGCGHFNRLCRIADGVDECRRAARDELRKGAHCIKLMGSGGAASPTDPIWMNQYTEGEIKAVVEECAARRSYVAAHCHPADAIRRCVTFGVRSIEHGTLIDQPTALFVKEKGSYIVPTLTTLVSLAEEGAAFGLSKVSQGKVRELAEQARRGLETMHSCGVRLGFGTDLLGELYVRQSDEFALRAEIQPALDVLCSATEVNAEIMQLQAEIGCIKPGARADLIVVDGCPIENIALLSERGRHVPLVIKDGVVVKNQLA